MIVHNITNRTGIGRAYWIGGQKVRPGKFVEVADDMIALKDRTLGGTVFFFGAVLPPELRAPALARVDTDAPPLTEDGAAEYLATCSQEELLYLSASMVPLLPTTISTPAGVLRSRLTKAVFAGNRTLDPSAFFWLRRWVRVGRTYLERE